MKENECGKKIERKWLGFSDPPNGLWGAIAHFSRFFKKNDFSLSFSKIIHISYGTVVKAGAIRYSSSQNITVDQ
jgi:hypothetical protein